jgi:hypothetical protein
MTRLVPGQRLHPASPSGYGPPVTVDTVGDISATLTHNGRLVVVYTDSKNGDHVTDWNARDGWRHYHTDPRREMLSERNVRRGMRSAIALALADADLDTLNRVLSALGLPEVTVWTPPENG